MTVVVAGSLLGIYEHLASNVEFESEMRPGAATMDVVVPALEGAAPLLAPGMLALTGVLAIGATYYHPALGKRRNSAVQQSSVSVGGFSNL